MRIAPSEVMTVYKCSVRFSERGPVAMDLATKLVEIKTRLPVIFEKHKDGDSIVVFAGVSYDAVHQAGNELAEWLTVDGRFSAV